MDSLPVNVVLPPRWDAALALEYQWRNGRSVLARRAHHGPLRVQRDLYPEGPGTCHTIVVHPPGGIAGGDHLRIRARLGTSAAALLTTPGAGKWYRANGRAARQVLEFDLATGAALEWLPQETIVFDGADADLRCRVQMGAGSTYLGWDVLCLGRRASAERFTSGCIQVGTEIWQDQRCLWIERGRLLGGDAMLTSPVGLGGASVCATMLAAGSQVDAEVVAACRSVAAGPAARAGITQLPNLVIARWLGDSSEDAKRYFLHLWTVLRPALRQCAAVPPRIWAT